MQKFALLLLFFGFAIGAMMPSKFEAPVASAEPERVVSQAAATPQMRQSVDLGTGAIRLSRNPDGHFYAEAQVNGAPVHFLVDTGATTIALTQEDARRASIPLDSSSKVVGMGAGGEIYGHDVQLDRVSLGAQEARDIRATVLDGGDQSLLGQTFLARFNSVVIEGDTMVLR